MSLVPLTPQSSRPSPLNIDTWQWVQSLTRPGTGLTPLQAESILSTVDRIATFRLSNWCADLPTPGRLHSDLNILRTIAAALDRQHRAHRATIESSQRGEVERITGDLHSTTDQLRDLTTAVRTDLALLVNAFKAESREDGQRLEMELHQLEGRLAAGMSLIRSEAENVKVRSIYTFALVIFSILLGAIVERSSRRNKERSVPIEDPLKGQI